MNSWTSQFGLYDFFSVLLPGTGFLLGLFPFFPESVEIGSIGALLPLLAGGYVAGQFLHIAAVQFEEVFPSVVSHREQFRAELHQPTQISIRTVNEFVRLASDEFTNVSTVVPAPCARIDQPPKTRIVNDEDVDALYTSVRGKLFAEGRSRSETFQAVFAFHRSIWFASLTLAIAYIWYALLLSGLVPVPRSVDLLPYVPKIAAFDSVTEVTLVVGVLFVVSLSYLTFNTAKDTYRYYYLSYLFSDYLRISSVQ